MEDFAGLGCNFVDTTDTDDEVNLRLRGDVEVARSTSSTLQPDLLLLLVKVLFHMSLSTLEDNFALSLGGLSRNRARLLVLYFSVIGCIVKV